MNGTITRNQGRTITGQRARRLHHAMWTGLLITIALGGCDVPAESHVGSAQVGVSVQAVSSEDVASVQVTVTGDGIDPPIVSALSFVDDAWSGLIEKIPAGESRTFFVEAMDDADTVIYSGSADSITIVEGDTVNVQIFLQQAVPPNPFENSVPRFTSLVISETTVAPGTTVTLHTEATDPDPDDTLTFAWIADAGSFDNAASKDVIWTAPGTAGEYQLTVRVTDDKGAHAAMNTVITVDGASSQDGSASVSLSLNSWPEVTSLSASITQIDANETTQLTLVATDPDEDTLLFAWQADCDGAFSDAAVQNPTFTLNSLPQPAADCVLTVEITDGQGGMNSATLSLATGPRLGTANNTPPIDALFATGFESGDPTFINLKSSGDVSNAPPAGTAPRNGSNVITLSSITSDYGGRDLQSEACISLNNELDTVIVKAFGTASSENGGNEISARITLLWFGDDTCTTPNADEDTSGAGVVLPESNFEPLTLEAVPPAGATHAKVRIEARDNNGGDNNGDDFAVDDLSVVQ